MLVPSLSASTAMRTGDLAVAESSSILPPRMLEFQTGRYVDVTESLRVDGNVADPPKTISRSCVREVHRVPAISSTLHATRGKEEGNSRSTLIKKMPNYLSLLR
jgi:hypothetical protein